MKRVSTLRRQRKNFDLTAKRRREIVLHARHVDAMDTEDRRRWLIAWVWHNTNAKDLIWSVMECAKSMGGDGGVGDHRGSLIYPKAPNGGQLGPLPGCHL